MRKRSAEKRTQTSPQTEVPFARQGFSMAPLLACNVACLVIASLYYTWRDVYVNRRKREQLHGGVAYMRWVAANRAA